MQHESEASRRVATLPAGLLVFQDLIHPIEGQWVQFGLGHDYGLGLDKILVARQLARLVAGSARLGLF